MKFLHLIPLLFLLTNSSVAQQTIKDLTVNDLKVVSTTKGAKPCPLMTETQRGALASPLNGQCIYNTTSLKLNVYNGSIWKAAGGGVDAWATSFGYAVNDLVIQSNKIYICLTAHTSGVFVTDLSAAKWSEISQGVTDHTALTSIGTNTHAQIDTAVTNSVSHIASVSNPHSVTKTQIGLGNVDNTSDATKNSAIATLTNKTLTAPVINSATGIVKADVGLSNVDNTSNATERAAIATLTNKTLTAPVINSPTGIVKADVGLGLVDNTSDVTKNSAAVTLTNKSISGLTNTLTDITATTNGAMTGEATSSGSTNAVTLANSAVIGKVLTGFVSGAGTVSSADSLLTAIQKINGNASNAGSISIKPQSGTSLSITEVQVPNNQSTLTATGKQLIETDSENMLINPNFEHSTATTGWTLGTSNTLTATTLSANLFSGAQDALLTTNATVAFNLYQDITPVSGLASTQGEITWAISVPASITDGKVCSRIAGIISTTNCKTVISDGVYREYSLPLIFGTAGQTAGLAFVTTATYASGASTVKVSKARLKAGLSYTSLNNDTDSVAFTPTGSWSGATYSGTVKRVGDKAEFLVVMAITGAVTNVPLDITLPSGYSIDANKAYTVTYKDQFGTATGWDGGNNLPFEVVYNTATSVRILSQNASVTYLNGNNISATSPVTWASGMTITARFSVPIVGWTSAGTAYSSTNSNYSRTPYTPTFTGLSSPTSVGCYQSRSGENLTIDCTFTSSAAGTATEARLSLPNSLVTPSSVPTLQAKGSYLRSRSSTDKGGAVFIEPSTGYVTFSPPSTYGSTSGVSVAKTNGDQVLGAVGEVITLTATIPISGWSNESIVTGSFAGIEKCTTAGECDDTYSLALTTTTGNIYRTSKSGWVTGCTAASPSICTINPSFSLTSPLNCVATPDTNTAGIGAVVVVNSVSQFSVRAYTSSTGADLASKDINIICQKTGADYFPKTAKIATSIGVPTVPGIVGVSTGDRIDTFSVSYGTTNTSTVCSSTPCFIRQIGSAINSNGFVWNSTGNMTLNTVRTYTNLSCSVGALSGAGGVLAIPNGISSCANCSSLQFVTYNTSSVQVNTLGNLNCIGSY